MSKVGPIVTNADRDWAIDQCPSWMPRGVSDDGPLPEIVDDGGWLEQATLAKHKTPSAFEFVTERIEEFERYFAGSFKTYTEWSVLWRKKWFPHETPAQRYPKSAPKTQLDPVEYERRLTENAGERKMSGSYFIIKPHDVQWKAWMDHFEATEPERVADAQANGELTAFGSRWPDKARRVQVQKAPRNPAEGR